MRRISVCLLLCCLMLSLVACNQPKTYDVAFMLDGEVYQTVTTDESGSFTMPTDPTVGEDYAFGGWYLDEGTWRKPFAADTAITANTTVYAKLVQKYTVEFKIGRAHV